jgi:hypothetical protein
VISIKPDGTRRVTLVGVPNLEVLKAAIGGGYLEQVPGFTAFEVRGEMRTCVAFCDEDGKRKGLPFNRPATVLWAEALEHRSYPGLLDANGRLVDHLVGDIAVVFGDAAFMEAL